MADLTIQRLKTTSNADILNRIRNDASLTYQQRVPPATQGDIKSTMQQLQKYSVHWNEFVDSLVNRIGSVMVRNNSWQNKLKEFKIGQLQYGDTIEEIQTGLVKARIYDADRDTMEKDLFGTHPIDVQTNFHTRNRKVWYPITVNETQLMAAFLENNGLSSFVSSLMGSLAMSDEWDEFVMTCQLFAEYESNGGFYKVQVPDVAAMTSVGDDSRRALRKMRETADNMAFLSTKYNAAKMPTFAKPEDLVVFTTPEFKAAIDVDALAAAFNIDMATPHGRIITVPQEHFNIKGCQAILTTKDFFVIADTKLENTSQYNAVSMGSNYYLHHWEIISASRFAPAVMLTTEAGNESITITNKINWTAPAIAKLADGTTPTDVKRGDLLALTAQVDSTQSPDGIAPKPEAVMWSLTGASSQRTFITSTGVLHVGWDEKATELTVVATTVYNDPDDLRMLPKQGVVKVTVSGPVLSGWPNSGTIAAIRVAGVSVKEPVAEATATYTVDLPKGTVLTPDMVSIGISGSADVNTKIEASSTNPTGYKVTVSVSNGAGAPKVYTVNVTVPA